MEKLIVLCIVTLAALIVVGRLYRFWRRPPASSGCGGDCCGCGGAGRSVSCQSATRDPNQTQRS